MGGLIATMADRTGPYLMRVRRVAAAAVFGGAAGLLIGTAINGRGWVAVPVMIVVAGVSALLSSVGAVWSAAGMFLLIYTTLSTGLLGALRPWWLTPLWFLAGVGWWLVLLVPGWLAFPLAVEQRQVATVYRTLAVTLRALGTEALGAARRGTDAAINRAFSELLGQRPAASGRDRELALLMSLIRQARLVHEAAMALDYAGERPPPREPARPLLVLARQVRGFAGMFAIRLMLCIGVATVLSP